jgi:hypothetical protein
MKIIVRQVSLILADFINPGFIKPCNFGSAKKILVEKIKVL